MHSIKHLLISKIFKSVLIIFVSTIFMLNIAFYWFSNSQYQREIDRQYDALYNMTAHLSTEDDNQTLEVYLEHYTHTNDVMIHVKDQHHITIFSNDETNDLNSFEEVYYGDTLVGYLAVNFESSLLGKDMLYGFLGLNLISLTLFTIGITILFKYLKKENRNITNDFNQIGIKDAKLTYHEMILLQEQLMLNQKQKEKQRQIYESHIKSLAHDIKTPLSVIQIYADSMMNGKITPSKDIFVDIQEETNKISDLIPKFIELDYVKLPYPQNISVSIESYVQKHLHIFDSKMIKVKTELDPLTLIISDLDLERLIEHLLLNAFYYSNQEKTISIFVNQEDKELIIHDEGIGMTSETIEHILNGPYRAKEAYEFNEKGSGIGYQVIRDIVKRLDARIKIESVLGQGTKIIIHFK